MEKRIGILGCGGTGKSLFGDRLASELGIPFLPSKCVTSDILRRDGYDYASGQHVEKFLSTTDRQLEILQRTIELHKTENFVTDRTAIDLAAYAILEMQGPLNVKRYVDDCRKLCAVYTHLFLCPWMDVCIEKNNKRTLDPWYQFAVNAVELRVIGVFDVVVCNVSVQDVEERVKYAMEAIELHPSGFSGVFA